jgi:molybdopterin converting factor small subunit
MSAKVTVLYFGAAEEAAGKPSEVMTADDTTSLSSRILEKYPAMRTVSFRLALNRVLIKEGSPLKENDIIAILPPFKGG